MSNYLSNPDASSDNTIANQAPASGDPGQPSAPPSSPSASPSASPTPAAPQTPGIWGRVLTGALQGLASGGLGGAIVGGVEATSPTQFNKMQQVQQQKEALRQSAVDEAQSNIQFKNAQAAAAVADAARINQTIAAYPQQMKDLHESHNLDMVSKLIADGYSPVVASQDSGDAAHAALTAVADAQPDGKVPPLAVFEVRGQHIAFNLEQMAASPQAPKTVNDANAAKGMPPITAQQWAATPAQMKTQMLEQALKFGNPSAPTSEPEARGSYLYYKSFLDALKKDPNADPAVVQQLTKVTDYTKSMAKGMLEDEEAKKRAEAFANTEAQQKAKEATSTELNAVSFDPNFQNPDGTKGANIVMSKAEAAAKGLPHYKVNPEKINALVGGVNDVQNKLNQLASVVSDPNRLGQVDAGLAEAMIEKGFTVDSHGVSVPFGRVNAAINSLNAAGANQATKDYVTAMLGAHEAITQLPRLQTFGQSSRMTEKQMDAAVALLPHASDGTALAAQKMASLQGLIDPIRKQVPIMPGAGKTPSWLEQRGQMSNPQTGAAPATATGPNGHRIKVVNGKWVDAQTGAPIQ